LIRDETQLRIGFRMRG